MPLVALLRAGDGDEGQRHGEQPQPALEVAQAWRHTAAEPLAEPRMDQLRQVAVAAAVAAPEQGDEAGAHDEAGADPDGLGEVEGGVIHGATGA